MSGGSRWRRIYSLEWHASAFQRLTDPERVVYFYAKTGPQSTSIGIYRISTAVAVEDIGNLMPIDFDVRLDVVCRACDWHFDPATRVLWIPEWLDENPPQSPNVCKSWRKLLANLPDCDLKFEAAHVIYSHLKDFPEAFREHFGSLPKELRNSKAKPKAKTEANQGAGDQGIQRSESRGSRLGSERQRAHSNNGSGSDVPAHYLDTARETRKLVSSTRPLEEQIDAFRELLRRRNLGECTKAQAEAAMQRTQAERQEERRGVVTEVM